MNPPVAESHSLRAELCSSGLYKATVRSLRSLPPPSNPSRAPLAHRGRPRTFGRLPSDPYPQAHPAISTRIALARRRLEMRTPTLRARPASAPPARRRERAAASAPPGHAAASAPRVAARPASARSALHPVLVTDRYGAEGFPRRDLVVMQQVLNSLEPQENGGFGLDGSDFVDEASARTWGWSKGSTRTCAGGPRPPASASSRSPARMAF